MSARSLPAQDLDLELEIQDLLKNFGSLGSSTEVVQQSLWLTNGGSSKICVCESLDAADMISFIQKNAVRSFIQRRQNWFPQDLRTALMLREEPHSYFSDPTPVILPDATETWSWNFSEKNEKSLIREHLLKTLENESAGAKEAVLTIFEELFMNACIDAPREAHRLGREMQLRAQARIILARSNDRLSLSCEDPYGTLSIDRFVNRMNEVYSQGAGQVINFEEQKGGAGLGCVLLFERSSSLILGVDKYRKTLVSCVVPRLMNHRQRDQVRKSFHIVEIEGGI